MKLYQRIIILLALFFLFKVRANDIMETDVINKGWMKYFVYYPEEKTSISPKAFFINSAYEAQGLNADIELKDEFGTVNIPDQFHFFFVLKKNAIYITSSRRNQIAKTVDIITLDSLAP